MGLRYTCRRGVLLFESCLAGNPLQGSGVNVFYNRYGQRSRRNFEVVRSASISAGVGHFSRIQYYQFHIFRMMHPKLTSIKHSYKSLQVFLYYNVTLHAKFAYFQIFKGDVIILFHVIGQKLDDSFRSDCYC